MTDMPEGGRQAAHVLLDAVSAWSADADAATNASVVQLAIERLNEIGAVTATLDEADGLHVNITNLVGGALVTMTWLIRQLSLTATAERDEVIVTAREFLDEDT
jgi:hypothetical protein